MPDGTAPPAPGPRLLFDQNLAAGLVRLLADVYPGSIHVRQLGFAAAPDEAIWSHAAAHLYIIVTKDDDFRQRSFLRGAPPQVIWVRLGNCSTRDVEYVLRNRHADVLAFAGMPSAALLLLTRAT